MTETNPDNLDANAPKPFEPTPIELRKQYNTLDNLIRMRSEKLRDQPQEPTERREMGEHEGFLPPFNSAF